MAVDADDVELEFISVMGVLVPMEVTKGVSSEASRFVGRGVLSDEENTNQVDVSNEVEHTEIKCTRSEAVGNTNWLIATEGFDCESKAQEKQEPKNKRLKKKQKKRMQKDTGPRKNVTTKVKADPETAECEDKKRQRYSNSTSLAAEQEVVQAERRGKRKRSLITRQSSFTPASNANSNHATKLETANGKKKVERTQENPSANTKKTCSDVMAKADSLSATGMMKQQSTSSKTGDVSNESVEIRPKSDVQSELTETKALEKQTDQRRSTRFRVAKKTRKQSILTEMKETQAIKYAKTSSARAQKATKKDIAVDGTSGEATIENISLRASKATIIEVAPTKQRQTTRTRISRLPNRGDDDLFRSELPFSTSNKQSNSEDRGSSTAKVQRCTSARDHYSAFPKLPQPVQSKSRCVKRTSRPRCSLPDCTRFAHSGGKCIAHGGGSRCSEDGCGRRSRSQQKCYAHGGGALCSHPNCTTRAKTKGKCVAHGGGTICSENECGKLVTANGKCVSHGGWVNCSHPGCKKRVQLRGKCMEHCESDATGQGNKPTKRFRKATIKPREMRMLHEKHEADGVGNSAAYEIMNKQTKEAKQAAVEAAKNALELDKSTMALRSGQRIKRVTQSLKGGLYSEDDALQMTLKLSESEY
ncbi:hypothetical protein GN244_ATG06383 [Phytophthora infestans]|uniref:WRKY19-like zinc finger domain-containing protein n=1 Tax=Phytophthora infestans TaxID=4787 RepID=A0A833SHZ2_PHYIN|nr:hypothetical protein GN244_ATG06383 [Phytophthora infestans]KAF4129816.1 hypothetical protein GN958_ATG20982 [Phytophthora infestans]